MFTARYELEFLEFRKIVRSDYWLPNVCPSVRPYGTARFPHWTDFHEI